MFLSGGRLRRPCCIGRPDCGRRCRSRDFGRSMRMLSGISRSRKAKTAGWQRKWPPWRPRRRTFGASWRRRGGRRIRPLLKRRLRERRPKWRGRRAVSPANAPRSWRQGSTAFGIPLVLNPILDIPFILAPVVTMIVGYILVSVSYTHLKKALEILVKEGLIIRRRGAGTFVKELNVSENNETCLLYTSRCV